MEKEIRIYYKDSDQDEYVTRRVLTQDGNYYKLTSYWKKGKNIERYESRLKLRGYNEETIKLLFK